MAKKKDTRGAKYGKNEDNNSYSSKQTGRKNSSGKSNRGSRSGHDSRYDSGYGGNDLSWYTAYPEMINAAANLPFPYQPGANPPAGDISAINKWTANSANEVIIVDDPDTFKYPGIAVIEWHPTTGNAYDAQSPINIAAKEIYARIRANYSGSLEADAPDIMMYLLALDSMYAYYSEVQRLYYMLNMWSTNNRFFPIDVLYALGGSRTYQHLVSEKDELFVLLSEMQGQLSKFIVPEVMNLFKRHIFLGSNIYMDKLNMKSQAYLFTMKTGFMFDEGEQGTELEVIDMSYGSVSQIREKWNQMMLPFMNWDTCYTILGYLERAFKDTKWLVPASTVMEGTLAAVYNEEVLLQIENLTVVPVDTLSLTVKQDPLTNNIICVPTTTGEVSTDTRYMKPGRYPINIPGAAQPMPGDIIVSTRLLATISDETIKNNNFAHVIDCATEIVSKIKVYLTRNPDELSPDVVIAEGGIMVEVDSSYFGAKSRASGDIDRAMLLFAVSNTWNHFPMIGFIMPTHTDPSAFKFYFSAQLENFTTIENEDLNRLHTMCLYSEYNSFNLS